MTGPLGLRNIMNDNRNNSNYNSRDSTIVGKVKIRHAM